MTLPGNLKVY